MRRTGPGTVITINCNQLLLRCIATLIRNLLIGIFFQYGNGGGQCPFANTNYWSECADSESHRTSGPVTCTIGNLEWRDYEYFEGVTRFGSRTGKCFVTFFCFWGESWNCRQGFGQRNRDWPAWRLLGAAKLAMASNGRRAARPAAMARRRVLARQAGMARQASVARQASPVSLRPGLFKKTVGRFRNPRRRRRKNRKTWILWIRECVQ